MRRYRRLLRTQGQHDPGHGLDDVVGMQRERTVDIPQIEREENEGRRSAQQHFVENGRIDLPASEKAAGHKEERRCQRNDERRRTELR